jgi:hypothetical protein
MMTDLSISEVVEAVRKNLDELDPNGNASVMYTDEASDNESLTDVIARFIPEAINAIHMAAPVALLEGKDFVVGDLDSVTEDGGVLAVTLDDGTDFLRLVAFRAKDSAIVVTDAIPEASAEGRKQLNPYIRGRYDRPRLVQLQGAHTGPSFKYYTLDTEGSGYSGYHTTPSSAIAQLTFIQEQFYDEDAEDYPISRRLRQNIIDYVTASVMVTYNDQRAQTYFEKANNFPRA